MRDWISLLENAESYTLYHGTCPENAERLMRDGWNPGSEPIGGNMGQSRYLYLTNGRENALWYAEQKGCSTVLKVTVLASFLLVDPEDGTSDSVEEELNWDYDLPGKVVCFRPLPASQISI